MFQVFRNAWKIEELRKKIWFTLFIILLYRIGNAVPVPFIDSALLQSYFSSLQNTVLGLYNMMSGNAFSSATIFALSIQPYINASIIIQLLCIAIPALERLSKEGGEEGRRKINSITRYSTVAIGLIMGFAYYLLIRNNSLLAENGSSFWAAIVIILTFVGGAALLMWLGEQITEYGIGNGISIILFASIVSRLPSGVARLISNLAAGSLSIVGFIGIIIGVAAIVLLIIFVSDAERRIPVQYAKRVVGRKMYGGQSTYLPMKVNMSGVMPIIFAQAIASLPATIAAFFRKPAEGTFGAGLLNFLDTDGVPYMIFYFLLIIAFGYFYATIQFNPIEVSNNLKKNGGFIPGYRPGKPTSEFITRVLNRITLFGSLYLGIVAVLPLAFSSITNAGGISLGGTSVIIVVGVAIEIVQGLENQMLMRHYKGFLD
ncbi:MAG: preprotein translocase subunit SecY [Oscillospiraceae bacterium]|nr:preprotein translocase subunit SecY [Oscillospiraceae bacterium]